MAKQGETGISWTEETINPIRARVNNGLGHYCEKNSPECTNCYSSRMQPRFKMPQFPSHLNSERIHIESFLDKSKLYAVINRRRRTRFFWFSMTDPFGHWVATDWIDYCVATMILTPQHIHMILTKRADRMMEYFSDPDLYMRILRGPAERLRHKYPILTGIGISNPVTMPQKWIWKGVTVGHPDSLWRIDYLLRTPAVIRFVSCEPLLANINFREKTLGQWSDCPECGYDVPIDEDGCCLSCGQDAMHYGIDWIIAGPETGPGRRKSNIEDFGSLRDQCLQARVPFHLKALEINGAISKSMAEMPEDLRIREFPEVR